MIEFIKFIFSLFKKPSNKYDYRSDLKSSLLSEGLTIELNRPIYSLVVTDFSEDRLRQIINQIRNNDYNFDVYKETLSGENHLYVNLTEIDEGYLVYCMLYPSDYINRPQLLYYNVSASDINSDISLIKLQD